jgi:hypothetical protein
MKYSENEIQSLKAQEAKDYCIELLRQQSVRDGGPISPGEVQLQELQYELRLKEAESDDQRQREASHQRLKELEIEIEQERARFAEAAQEADAVRARHAEVIQQVSTSQEKLSFQLERATREHNVKMQMMRSAHDEKQQQLVAELDELSGRRDALASEIGRLADLQESAVDIDRLRQELEERRLASTREQKELDEEIESARFEKQKELARLQREQELELAELHATHRGMLFDVEMKSVDKLLDKLGFKKIKPEELSSLKSAATERDAKSESDVESIKSTAINEFRKQFNIGSQDTLDVTALFYSQKALQEENAAHQQQVQKLESEVARMRSHIEEESIRLAKAIEAARTNIQNTIEPGVKR